MSFAEGGVLVGEADPFGFRRAVGASGLLGEFNSAGVVSAADVRVAERLLRLGGLDSEAVGLAVSFAVRATRLGSVFVDLGTISQTVTVDTEEPVDLGALAWPEPEAWVREVAGGGLVAGGGQGDGVCPLRLEGSRLYLHRYWSDEVAVAEDLLAFDAGRVEGVDLHVLREGVLRLLPSAEDESQRRAAAVAVLRRLSVIAGGPGTGKTTTISHVVALLCEQAVAAGRPLPLIGLAAPTARAANRLTELLHAGGSELEVVGAVREHLRELGASTIHRLLGGRPDSNTRFRHDRQNRLPHDVIVIDETSMVPLPLMARLLEAVRPDARVVLVGDPGQLASVEAGAVLGDVVGPALEGSRMSTAMAELVGWVCSVGKGTEGFPPVVGETGGRFGDGVVVLERVHRFGDAIGQLADAVRSGDGERFISLLRGGATGVTWLEVDAGEAADAELGPVRDGAVAAGRAAYEAASGGDAAGALEALRAFMVLCAHRRGPHGVTGVTDRVREWLAAEVGGLDVESEWFVGQPLLVTKNDYENGLHNGDIGVIIKEDLGGGPHLSAIFDRTDGPLRRAPASLGTAETVYSMTIHKSQGSQFGTVAVVVPPAGSRILTRELLYTAVTRAMNELIVVGTEEMLLAAVNQPMARTSGLRERLWGS